MHFMSQAGLLGCQNLYSLLGSKSSEEPIDFISPPYWLDLTCELLRKQSVLGCKRKTAHLRLFQALPPFPAGGKIQGRGHLENGHSTLSQDNPQS